MMSSEERTPTAPEEAYASKAEYIAAMMPDLLALRGQAVTVAEAVKENDVPQPTIHGWIQRGYIAVRSAPEEYPKKIDRLDVAYCARLYHARQAEGTRSGAPLLDEAGLPYKFKTGMAEYRRKLRREKKQKPGS